MSDLSLVSTDELISELQARFEAHVFVGHMSHDAKSDQTIYRYAGNWLTCLGALQRVTHIMQQEMDEDADKMGMSDA